MFTSWDPRSKNVTFNTAFGMTISSRVVGTVKFRVYDDTRKHLIATMYGAYYVPHQPHNIVAVGQLTRNSLEQRESPDVKNYVWQNNSGTKISLEYVNQEFI